MTVLWRTSALADRHRQLGSMLEDWNGMGTAWTYTKDISDEHVAIRTRAGLMDVSGLKKVHVVGPDAAEVINHATTRDVSKLYPGRSAYGCLLNDNGHFTDDCIIYRLTANSFLFVHGSGSAQEELARSAVGKKVAIFFDDDLHDISLQGPVAVDFLAQHVPGVRDLKYFHHMQTTLFGRNVMISRTGYTGERGYEIFASAKDVSFLWDSIVENGAGMGIMPCCFTVLDWLRVESCLLFYPYDNSPDGDSLWELGLDFTVSPGKKNFRGAEKHFSMKGTERVKIFGVLVEGSDPTEGGDELYADGKNVGYITCGMYSKLTKRSMAIARLDPSCAKPGIRLEVRGKNVRANAVAHELPFDDPEKKKRTAVG